MLRQIMERLSAWRTRSPADGGVSFRGNICGARNRAALSELNRETPSCTGCGSTVRMRAVIHLLSLHLFGVSLPIKEFPLRHHLSAAFGKLRQDERMAIFERSKAVYEGKWGPWTPHRYRA